MSQIIQLYAARQLRGVLSLSTIQSNFGYKLPRNSSQEIFTAKRISDDAQQRLKSSINNSDSTPARNLSSMSLSPAIEKNVESVIPVDITEMPDVAVHSQNSQITNMVGFSSLPDNLYKTIELELLAYESGVLDSYQWFILTAASHLGIEVERVWEPRKSEKFRFPLLKSCHIFKKHRVHYEIRTYHKFITLKKLTGSTASTYLEYIQRNLPEGIGMKVSKLEILPKPDYMINNEST